MPELVPVVVDRVPVGGPAGPAATLHRETYGTGPTVLVGINGGPGYGCDYMRPLAALAGVERRVVLYDQLGTGRSDSPPAPPPGSVALWSMAEYARHLDVIRRHCGVAQLDVVGHSFGGMIALEYALRYPAGVRRLVIANSAASIPRFVESQLHQVGALFGEPAVELVVRAERSGRYDDADYERIAARFYAWADGKPYDQDGVDVAAWRRQMIEAGPALYELWGPGMFTATAALRDWDVQDRLTQIRTPTLIVSSERDHCPPEITAPMADAIPGARWVMFQRTPHSVLGPEALVHDLFLGLLTGFLTGGPPPAIPTGNLDEEPPA